eukprot:Em0011g514a
MQPGSNHRALFTSLAGISPLTDVLADLPIPSHYSTSLEQTVAGRTPLTAESMKVVNSNDIALSMQIASALTAVDCSFLKLKTPVVWQPYTLLSNCPPLIQAVISNTLLQPMVQVKKLDTVQFSNVGKTETVANAGVRGDECTVEFEDAYAYQAHQRPGTKLSKSHSNRRKNSDIVKPLKKSKLAPSTEIPKDKEAVKPRTLVVSIERVAVSKLATLVKQKEDPVAQLPVRFPRSKLKGKFSAVRSLPSNDGLPVNNTTVENMDTTVSSIKKSKNRKASVIDYSKATNIKRFMDLLGSVFDSEEHGDGDVSRPLVSQVVTEVAKLKQQAILNQVPVEDLVKLITLMDKHVLGATELHLNPSCEDAEYDGSKGREQLRERILRSLDASLVILHIATAPNMPQNVLLEEAIEQVIALTKFHLETNIYPEFDPVYRVESKESGVMPKQKRRYTGASANKDVLAVYHKLVEVVENLALLVEAQPLTDTIVLQISSLGVSSFFVENISALQLSALRLARAVFSRYETHRDLIMEDIFASLARLPTSKRNLRTFRLANNQCVQMVTALILQLVQCIVVPPVQDRLPCHEDEESKTKKQGDVDMLVINSYELALRTGKNFLSTFMRKCCTGKEEDDFRPLFENFVSDLLTILNLPEWPAAEVLLTLLGMLLVHAFMNRNNEISLRLIALDHLGVIAARLRQDGIVSMERDHDELINILAQILQSKLEVCSLKSTGSKMMDAFSENTQHFQKALIAHLTKRCAVDPACGYARDFYLGQWLRDCQQEMERVLTGSSSQPEFPIDPIGLDGIPPPETDRATALQDAEQRQQFLHSMLERTELDIKQLEDVLDDRSACTVSRFLGSFRALSKSFNTYLQQLLRVLNEPAVHVRSRAMKALSTIVAADPSLLSRLDLQRGVHSRFLDQSTLVREAAVDLVGRFVLSCPDLAVQYYEMLGERILDTGVSVRKRVIKILKDICMNQPNFSKIDEICVKIMKRINDEEGIKQLVTTVFQQLWFTPPEGANKREILLKRAKNITNVVDACKESECFEQLLEQLFKNEDSATKKSMLEVSQLLVDTLVENVLSLDESAATHQHTTSVGLVACITTLYIFCKIRPNLLLKHATTLHPYLSSKCSTQNDMLVVSHVAHILEQVVPKIEHPSESFMRELEEDLVKLIMKHGQMIVQGCVFCLGTVVNSVTHNYQLVKETFMKFFVHLEKVHTLQTQDSHNPQLPQLKATVLRSVFTVGLLCNSFDLDVICQGDEKISSRVHSLLVSFAKAADEEIQLKSVTGLGFFYLRYPELMLEQEPKAIYQDWLSPNSAVKKMCQVLKNLQNYFKEVEAKLKVESDASKKTDPGNLLEFGDHHSSVCSNVAQSFLSVVLESSFNSDVAVRMSSLHVVVLILRQGLVHPAQCVPYLIAMSTDPEAAIRIKAEQQLTEHSSKYGQIMQSHLIAGVKRSYMFLRLASSDLVRGCTEHPTASQSVLAHVYTLVRSNKQHRRAFLKALLRHFEELEKTSLEMLLFLSDNLAHFPYATLEEPLFVAHHIDVTLSVTGTTLLQSFNEAIWGRKESSNEDIEDIHSLMLRDCNIHRLAECCYSSYGCFLLLLLKRHLQRCYALSDSKCQKYTPNESNKTYEKAVTKKCGISFDPNLVVDALKNDMLSKKQTKTKEEYLKTYLEFKQMMNKLDPFDADDDLSDHEIISTTTAVVPSEAVADDSKDPKPQTSVPQKVRIPSTSSNGSTGQRKTKRSKPRKQRFISSGGSDDDPDFK